jgi:hypothetical protein
MRWIWTPIARFGSLLFILCRDCDRGGETPTFFLLGIGCWVFEQASVGTYWAFSFLAVFQFVAERSKRFFSLFSSWMDFCITNEME